MSDDDKVYVVDLNGSTLTVQIERGSSVDSLWWKIRSQTRLPSATCHCVLQKKQSWSRDLLMRGSSVDPYTTLQLEMQVGVAPCPGSAVSHSNDDARARKKEAIRLDESDGQGDGAAGPPAVWKLPERPGTAMGTVALSAKDVFYLKNFSTCTGANGDNTVNAIAEIGTKWAALSTDARAATCELGAEETPPLVTPMVPPRPMLDLEAGHAQHDCDSKECQLVDWWKIRERAVRTEALAITMHLDRLFTELEFAKQKVDEAKATTRACIAASFKNSGVEHDLLIFLNAVTAASLESCTCSRAGNETTQGVESPCAIAPTDGPQEQSTAPQPCVENCRCKCHCLNTWKAVRAYVDMMTGLLGDLGNSGWVSAVRQLAQLGTSLSQWRSTTHHRALKERPWKCMLKRTFEVLSRAWLRASVTVPSTVDPYFIEVCCQLMADLKGIDVNCSQDTLQSAMEAIRVPWTDHRLQEQCLTSSDPTQLLQFETGQVAIARKNALNRSGRKDLAAAYCLSTNQFSNNRAFVILCFQANRPDLLMTPPHSNRLVTISYDTKVKQAISTCAFASESVRDRWQIIMAVAPLLASRGHFRPDRDVDEAAYVPIPSVASWMALKDAIVAIEADQCAESSPNDVATKCLLDLVRRLTSDLDFAMELVVLLHIARLGPFSQPVASWNFPAGLFLALSLPILLQPNSHSELVGQISQCDDVVEKVVKCLLDPKVVASLDSGDHVETLEAVLTTHVWPRCANFVLRVACAALDVSPHAPTTVRLIERFLCCDFNQLEFNEDVNKNIFTLFQQLSSPEGVHTEIPQALLQRTFHYYENGRIGNFRSSSWLAIKILVAASAQPSLADCLQGFFNTVQKTHPLSPRAQPRMWFNMALNLRSTHQQFTCAILQRLLTPCEPTSATGTIRTSVDTLHWNWTVEQGTEAVSEALSIGNWDFRVRAWPAVTSGDRSMIAHAEMRCHAMTTPPTKTEQVEFSLELVARYKTHTCQVLQLVPWNFGDVGIWLPVHGVHVTGERRLVRTLECKLTVVFSTTKAQRVDLQLVPRAITLLSSLSSSVVDAQAFLKPAIGSLCIEDRTLLLQSTVDDDPKFTLTHATDSLRHLQVGLSASVFFEIAMRAAEHMPRPRRGAAVLCALDAMEAWLQTELDRTWTDLPKDPGTRAERGFFTDVLADMRKNYRLSFAATAVNGVYAQVLRSVFEACAKFSEHATAIKNFLSNVHKREQAKKLALKNAIVPTFHTQMTKLGSASPPFLCACPKSDSHRSVMSCAGCAVVFGWAARVVIQFEIRCEFLGLTELDCEKEVRHMIHFVWGASRLRVPPGQNAFKRFFSRFKFGNDWSFPKFTGFQEPVHSTGWLLQPQLICNVDDVTDRVLVTEWLETILTSSGVAPDPMLRSELLRVLDTEDIDIDVLATMTADELTQVFTIQASSNPDDPIIPPLLISAKVASRIRVRVQQAVVDPTLLDPRALSAVLSALLHRKPRQAFWDMLQPDAIWMRELDEYGLAALSAFGFLDASPDRNDDVVDSQLLRGYRNALQHSSFQARLPAVWDSGKSHTPCRIVAVGNTGAGKSTLLNAVLDEVQITPTNGMRACTATIVEFDYLRSPTEAEVYRGQIEFIKEDEWVVRVTQDLNAIQEFQNSVVKKSAVDDVDIESVGLNEDKLASDSDEAILRLTAVYGSGLNFETATVDELIAKLKSFDKLGTVESISAVTAAELSDKCAVYIDSANDLATGTLWPLVKRVKFQGPWGALACGATLIDAPGLHDSNTARATLVRSTYQSADSLWLVSNIKRAVNDKTIQDLLPLGLRNHLTQHGVCGQLVHIATQADVCVRSEIITNLKLPSSTSLQGAAEARSHYTKRLLTANFYHGIDRKSLPINNADSNFGLPCFTVSAVDYQKVVGLRKGDGAARVFRSIEGTQIPSLRRYIAEIAARLYDPVTWPGVRSGELLLRYESTQPLELKCAECAQDMEVASPMGVCDTCLDGPHWDCSGCGKRSVKYAEARKCEASHFKSPIIQPVETATSVPGFASRVVEIEPDSGDGNAPDGLGCQNSDEVALEGAIPSSASASGGTPGTSASTTCSTPRTPKSFSKGEASVGEPAAADRMERKRGFGTSDGDETQEVADPGPTKVKKAHTLAAQPDVLVTSKRKLTMMSSDAEDGVESEATRPTAPMLGPHSKRTKDAEENTADDSTLIS